jgi:hypothetical protein
MVILRMAGKAKFISSGTRWGNGAGAGDGWGGPARGASTAKPRANASALIPGQPPGKRAITEVRRQSEAEIAAEMREKILHLARYAEREETQLAAACKLLDRIEGLPVVRTIMAKDDELSRMTDEEIRAELERLEALEALEPE